MDISVSKLSYRFIHLGMSGLDLINLLSSLIILCFQSWNISFVTSGTWWYSVSIMVLIMCDTVSCSKSHEKELKFSFLCILNLCASFIWFLINLLILLHLHASTSWCLLVGSAAQSQPICSLPHHCPWVEIICCHPLAQLKWNIWALWGHKGKWNRMAIQIELEVQWWMSLISSLKRGFFYLTTSPGPTQLSHFWYSHVLPVLIFF